LIRHCVFVKFRPSVSAADRSAIYADLAALQDRIPGMLRVSAGRNVSPEGLGRGFEEGFLVDFTDASARDAYLDHPDHKAIGARIGEAAEGGVDGIFVFDLALD